MATNTGNVFVDALAGEEPWDDGLNLKLFFDNGGAGGAWTNQEIGLFINAFLTWAYVANVGFTVVYNEADADLIERKETDAFWPGRNPTPNASHANPPDDSEGTATGHFNASKAEWNTTDLVVGGYFHSTFVHELGHALGFDHPHFSAGNDALNFPGVDSQSDSGDNDLNQRIWTVLSYVRTANATDDDFGQSATPMAFDVAAIQVLYGANMGTGRGDTVYTLPGSEGPGTFFSCIWDVSGNDWIVWDGNLQATIDLRPATLANAPGGGGFLSQIMGRDGVPIHGGFTIAADFTNALGNVGTETGVIIENARGGGGNDTIRGNNAGNALYGNGGDDTIEGFDGADWLDQGYGGGGMYGGNGADTLVAGDGADWLDGGNDTDTVNYSRSTAGITLDPVSGKIYGGWAQGDTLISIENVVGTAYADSIWMGSENNTIWGGGGNDNLDGRGGINTLYGEGGNDSLHAGFGLQVGDLYHIGDWFDGGADWDTVSFGSAVTVNLQTGVHSGEALDDTFISIEQFNGSAQNDVFVARSDTAAWFAAGDGQDQLYGSGADDWLQGGRMDDLLNGGGGRDIASYADAPGGIIADLTFDGDTSWGHTDGKIIAGEWGTDTLVSMEDVEGSNFSDNLYGDERSNRLYGLGGNDRIEGDYRGSRSVDYMYGGNGDDTIYIGDGDFAYGGNDFDTAIFENTGAVYLNYNTGDFLVGGQRLYLTEFESYTGTGVTDRVWGGNWGERINLGAGDDEAHGQDGNDFIFTGAGTDILDGGNGRDTVVFHKAMVADWQSGVLDADIATDSWIAWEVIQGSDGDDRIRTNSWGYAVELRGGGGRDVLAAGVSGIVSDILRGEAGNDELDGGAGADSMFGGTGDDRFRVDQAGDVVTELAGEGFDTVLAAVSYALAAGSHVEALQAASPGTTTAIRLTGNDLAQTLTGNAGANLLLGNGGDDFLEGRRGGDDLRGGAGLDFASYAHAAAAVVADLASPRANAGEAAGDTYNSIEGLLGSAFADTLRGDAAANRLDGGGAADRMVGRGGDDTYVVDHANDQIVEAGGEGNDTILAKVSYVLRDGVSVEALRAFDPAATAPINLTGNGLANLLVGNEAANRLDGLGGADEMRGGLGGDTYVVDHAGDRVVEGAGAGVDLVQAAVSFSLAGQHADNLTLTGAGNTNATGNGLANRLIGNGGNNRLDGLGGADRLEGKAGNDLYVVDHAGDVVVETADQGFDTVLSSVGFSLAGQHIEHLTLTGAGDISATGNGFNNVIRGNTGQNRITGGGLGDELWAGADNVRDVFVFAAAGDSGLSAAAMDTIFQFDRSAAPGDATSDRIDLSLLDADPDPGNQAFRFVSAFTTAAPGQSNGQVRVDIVGPNARVYIDLDGNNTADMAIAILNVTAISDRDFIL